MKPTNLLHVTTQEGVSTIVSKLIYSYYNCLHVHIVRHDKLLDVR